MDRLDGHRRGGPLLRLTYMSQSTSLAQHPTPAQARAHLWAQAQRLNRPSGLTGALLIHSDWFLQTLEGTPEAVYTTLARINLDPRHQNLRIFEAASTASRLFEPWAMHVAPAEEVSPLALGQCSHAFRHARYPHPEPLLAALKESTKAA